MQKITTDLPIFVLNLLRSKERKIAIENAFKKKNLTCTFIEAVEGNLLTEEEILKSVNKPIIYNNYGREITKGEIGCALSHRKVYKKMVSENIKHAIVLEDDIILKDNFLDGYKMLSGLSLKNIIIKIDPSVEEKGSFSLFGKIKCKNFILKKNVFDTWCAAAYYIDIEAAKKILTHFPLVEVLADHWILLSKKSKLRSCVQTLTDFNLDHDSTLEDDRKKTVAEKYQKKISFFGRCMKKIKHVYKKWTGFISPFN
ncbi:MAG: glycosyltransferase family 25 protein [Spirochaetales bacterium]